MPLASLADPALVETAAAQALGSKDTLAATVGDKRLMLVLDNFEHLLDAAAGLAETVGACPRMTVLVTSREPLHVDGEWEVAVNPLHEREAMELFVQRAAAVRSDFAANGEVAEICRRLDGLPLAIELAAARVKALSLPVLLERLEQRLPLLAGGSRSAPERQRTLRATIGWSHDLLTEVEQELFARLAVFAVAGQVYVAGLTPDAPGGPGVRPVPALAPAADPRPDPAGTLVAYACGGSLRVIGLAGGSDRAVAGPEGAGVTHGLAEFIAAEEMRRMRGYWWAPDSTALLVARVDENPVPRLYIADPADPSTAPAQVRYPAAGTQNADVTLAVVGLDGRRTEVSWDRAAYPYLAAACWQDGGPPLLVVQSRDQRRQQLLAVEAGTGATSAVRDESDPHWLNLMPGVPARTSSGRVVWTSDEGGTRHLIIGTQPDNVRDYVARRGRASGPLADRRGARGRAVAIRAAILTARRAGADIEEALQRAIEAGIPPHQDRLF